MFGLGIPEILFILLLAALILGPEHMPRAARMIGRWSSKLRSAATTFGNAVASDADLSELKTDLSEVKKEIDAAKKELLAPKTELEQISAQTHEAFEKAREELKSIQGMTGRDLNKNSEDSDLSEKNEKTEAPVVPMPNAFMSRPLGAMTTEMPASAREIGLRVVRLSKARFLPEEISRLVVRRRFELDEPENAGEHRHIKLDDCNKNAAFLRIRSLDGPVNEKVSSQRRVKLDCVRA